MNDLLTSQIVSNLGIRNVFYVGMGTSCVHDLLTTNSLRQTIMSSWVKVSGRGMRHLYSKQKYICTKVSHQSYTVERKKEMANKKRAPQKTEPLKNLSHFWCQVVSLISQRMMAEQWSFSMFVVLLMHSKNKRNVGTKHIKDMEHDRKKIIMQMKCK